MEDFRFSSEKMPSTNEQNNPLEEILRKGAQKLLQQAIEFEVQEYLELYKQSNESTHQSPAVRNGYLPEKNIQTGLGPIAIRQPRIRHRDDGKFTSAILPPYLRRTQSIDAVISALYLKGISTLDFPKALEAILGENAKGLSPTNIFRLKDSWTTEYQNWLKSDLSAKKYVYIWADG
ncbi:transposase, partial [Parachlamydia acanthamoebae]|uniref:transposase n=1 Tax=Parachlamydia acanthamoebae TaxID=83552 RepID=UPI000B089863